MVAVGVMPLLASTALLMAVTGVGTSVVNTYGISWLQRRTDPATQGRVMSLVMLAPMGLTHVSYATSGAIAQVNPTLLFLIAGGMIPKVRAALRALEGAEAAHIIDGRVPHALLLELLTAEGVGTMFAHGESA